MNAAFSLRNISIRTKIIGMAGILLALMIGSTAYALYKMNQVGNEIETIAEEDMPLIKVITEITIHQLEQAINFERALRYGEEMQTRETSSEGFKTAISKFDQLSAQVNKELKEGEALAHEAMLVAHTEADKKEFKHVEEMLLQVEKQHTVYEEHVHEIFDEIKNHNIEHAIELAETVEAEEEKIDHELKSLLTEIETFTEEATLKAEHDEKTAFSTLSVIAVISLIVGIFISSLIVRTITKGISRAVHISEVVASGNLSEDIQVDSNDEIGKLLGALKNMQDKLRSMVMTMQQSASELAASSEELATVTEQTSRNIAQETTEIQQSATAVHEMTATVDEVAKNAAATAESATQANVEANSGNKAVQDTISSIQQLAQTIESSSGVIHQVGEDSQSIGTVLDVIKNIAEQTNLLALNAAIEAARAGEQGRGFAVVADEVRTLAQRTQTSTHEIEEMITKLQGGAKNAVHAMEAGQEQAQNCVNQASDAGGTLSTITTSVSTINDMNTQIATAAEEQTLVANEIGQSITELSQITDQNSTAVTEMAATSEEVARMAAGLQDLTTQFRLH